MKPLHRSHVNKQKAAKSFQNATRKTKAANIGPGLARGGIRL
ncbi:MAG: hypothetical protein [Microvirus sp.]|nr:MAG: hypothetical protein [Microvirus sp.]